MTERTLKLELTCEEAKTLRIALADKMVRAQSRTQSNDRRKLLDKVIAVETMLEMMAKATVLLDNQDIILFENPFLGDEAPVMAYFKEDGTFEENTEEYDADEHTADMILENHRAVFRRF